MAKEKAYQIVKKPDATATGAPGEWSFVAHGAVYHGAEGCDIERLLANNGYATKRLPL